MKIDAALPDDVIGTPINAVALEEDGYDGVWIAETSHDPFIQAVRAAEHTRSIQVCTGVAVALARNPMTVATSSWDLAQLSGGRFILGIGSQIQSHIERRFSMPWTRPAARMREFVLALHAIWDCWDQGVRLDFRGEMYTYTLMTPLYTPRKLGFERPPVFLAGVGPRMSEVAGEVADGFIAHSFSTAEYLRAVTIPALEAGRRKATRPVCAFPELYCPVFVATGRDEQELARAVLATKEAIAFYASTPAYRGVLEQHGWGKLQTDLLAERDRRRRTFLIDDDVVAKIAIVGEPDRVVAQVHERFAGVASRVSLYAPYEAPPAVWREIAREIRRTCGGT